MGEEEEPGVVHDEVEVLLSPHRVPADERIPGGALPRRGGEAQKGEDVTFRSYEVPQLRSRQGRIAEVVVLLDVGVPEGARALLDDLDIERAPGHRVGLGQRKKFRLLQVIVRRPLRGRQEDMTIPLHAEKSDAAAHLLQAPVGFPPLDLLAERPGEAGAVHPLADEVTDEADLAWGEPASAVLHGGEYTEDRILCPALFQGSP